jgi:hypothetical protein
MVSARALRSWTVGLAVFALLLKAAVPMLASAAARLQGVPVAQVCDIYGVQTVLDAAADPHAGHEGHAGHGDAPGDGGSHAAGDADSHCALVALGVFTAGEPPALPPYDAREPARHVPAADASHRHDAAALWVARLKQGPPSPA